MIYPISDYCTQKPVSYIQCFHKWISTNTHHQPVISYVTITSKMWHFLAQEMYSIDPNFVYFYTGNVQKIQIHTVHFLDKKFHFCSSASSTLTTYEYTEDDTLVMFGWMLWTFSRKDALEEGSKTIFELTGGSVRASYVAIYSEPAKYLESTLLLSLWWL